MIIAELDKANSEASTASGSVQGVACQRPHRTHRHRPSFTYFLDNTHLSVELPALGVLNIIEAGLDVGIRVIPSDLTNWSTRLASNRQLIATPLSGRIAPEQPADPQRTGHPIASNVRISGISETAAAHDHSCAWPFIDG